MVLKVLKYQGERDTDGSMGRCCPKESLKIMVLLELDGKESDTGIT